MAITQYSPIPNQQVIQQYQPQDFRYLIAAGENKQHAYDESEATVARGQEMLQNVKVINGDVADKNSRVQKYMTDAQDLVRDKYNNDWGQALPEIKRLANGVTRDPWFDHAARNYDLQQEADKRRNAFKSTPLTWNNSVYTGKTSDDKGGYNTLSYDAEERMDYAKPKIELMKDIAKDSRLSGITQSQIAGVLEHGSMKGVDASKVFAVAKNMLQTYMTTPEGVQEMRAYMSNGATPEQAQATMLRSLAGIGSKQIGNESTMGYMATPGYVYKLRKADKAAEDNKQLMEGPEFTTGMMTNANAPTKIAIDGNGRAFLPPAEDPEYKLNMGQAIKGQPAGGLGAALFDPTRDARIAAQKASRSQAGYVAGDKAVAQLRSSYNKIYKGEPGYNAAIEDKELIKLHNTAVDNSGEVAMRGVQLVPNAAAATSSMLLGPNWKQGDISGLQGRMMMPVSTTGAGGKLVTLPEAMKQFGLSDKSKISAANVVGRNPLSPIPGAYTVRLTITDEHGRNPQQKEMLVAGSKQEQDFQGQFQPLVDAAMAGKPGRVDVGDVHLRSVSAPGKDGKFHHQIRSYEINSRGEYIAMRERVTDRSGNPVLDAKGRTIIKKDANGRQVYAKPQSLDAFTNDMYSVFQRAHPDLFNVAGYTAKDEKEQISLSEE